MKTTINRYLFASTAFDSGSLGVLTSVIHQFSRPGLYQGAVHQNGQDAGMVSFEVSDRSTNMQLDVDLSAARTLTSHADCKCANKMGNALQVSPKGYVLFYTSKGVGGYSVTVGDAREKGAPLFDSQNLTNGDLFALSLMEPTAYLMRNTLGSAKGEIIVTFTPKDGVRLKSLKTEMIDVAKDKFTPAQVRLTSTQGLVFRATENARVVIERKAAAREKESAGPTPRRIQRLLLRQRK